jgi:VCBS repeat-containing protein
LSVTAVSGAVNGAVVLNGDGTITFTPTSNFSGTAGFDYTLSDGALTDIGHVTVTVTAVNDAPVANADAYSVNEGATLTKTAVDGVLANDTDADTAHTALTTALVTGPTHHVGTFTLNGDGRSHYVHDGSETTTTASPTKRTTARTTANVATVTITVNSVNDAPVANADAYSVNEGATLTKTAVDGVVANDTDVDTAHGSLTTVLVAGPTHHVGTFTLNADGSFTYVHDGSETTADSFTYKANDGSADSNVATVSITVSAVNDAPVANNDAYSVNEGDDADKDGRRRGTRERHGHRYRSRVADSGARGRTDSPRRYLLR